jgi:hypothetical protein
MGEEIEVTDVNGNKVKVPLYPLLDALADALRGRLPLKTTTGAFPGWLVIDRVED